MDVSAKTWSPTTTVTGDQLMDFMLTPGINPVITGVEIIGNQNKKSSLENISTIRTGAKLNTTGLSVFKGDKLIGWLNEDESKGYNYIRGNVKSTMGHVDCPSGEGVVTMKTLRASTDRKAKVVNGEPQVKIKLHIVSSVASVDCSMQIGSMTAIRELEKVSEDRLKELMQKSVNAVRRKYHVDIFGFGQEIYQNDPKFFKKVENDWDKYFENLDVVYETKAQIRRVGALDNSFKNQIKD